MGVQITEVDNPVLYMSEGKKQIFETTFGNRAGAWEATLLNTTKPTVVDHLEFSTDSATLARLRIFIIKDGVELPLRTLNTVGSALINFTPADLTSNSTSLFQILEFNDTSNIYKLSLRNPLYLPEGGRITISNTGSTAINVGALLTGRYLL